MTCQQFEELLFEALDGRIDADQAQALDRHAAGCGRCAELRRLATGEDAERIGEPDGLLVGIMAASGIDACGSARERLIDQPPAALEALDPVLALHVAGCARCMALHRALRALRHDLPVLAELDPGPDLVDAVVRATSAAPRRADWWARLLGRPRLALEGAYLGTLILILTFGTPAAAITRLPGVLLQELRQDGLGVSSTLAEGWDGVTRIGADGWRRVSEQVDTYVDAAPSLSEARQLVEREVAGWWAELTRRWQQVWNWLVESLIGRVRALTGVLGWPDQGRENDAGDARPNRGVRDERDSDDGRAGEDA